MPTKATGDTLSASEINLKPDVHRIADLATLAAYNPNPALESALSHALVPGFGLYRYDSASAATADGVLVVTAAPGGRWLRAPERAVAPTAPTIARADGQTGTLTYVSGNTAASRAPDSVSFALEYDWTPAATTTQWTLFSFVPPSGWTVAHASVGSATVTTDAAARPSAQRSAQSFLLRNETVNPQRVSIIITLVRA